MSEMRVGITVPTFDALADASAIVDLARCAEEFGLDGFFVWDHIYYDDSTSSVAASHAILDPWITLALVATATSRIRIGALVTPLARRRPHVLARQALALDHVSGGRFVLGTGLGLDNSGREFERFGEGSELGQRTARYVEGLALVRQLTSGERFTHAGAHYTADDVQFLPGPIAGRIPMWLAARWPNAAPMERARNYDGAVLLGATAADVTSACLRGGALSELPPDFNLVAQVPFGTDLDEWTGSGARWVVSTIDLEHASYDDAAAEIRRLSTNRAGQIATKK